jgi:hypothetical protein
VHLETSAVLMGVGLGSSRLTTGVLDFSLPVRGGGSSISSTDARDGGVGVYGDPSVSHVANPVTFEPPTARSAVVSYFISEA